MNPNEFALLNACTTNQYHLTSIETLLKAGVNVNIQGISRRTPLHWTSEYNNAELTSLLLKYKANTEIKNYAGQTPLHLAASYDSLKVIKLLIAAGADVEARDSLDSTPLHMAIYHRCEESAYLLITEGGACIDKTNRSGLTPIELAYLTGNPDLGRDLSSYYSKINILCINETTPLNSIKQEVKLLMSGPVSSLQQANKVGITPNAYTASFDLNAFFAPTYKHEEMQEPASPSKKRRVVSSEIFSRSMF